MTDSLTTETEELGTSQDGIGTPQRSKLDGESNDPSIKYTKTGRVKKPASEAQKEALRKAREAYTIKHTQSAELRRETDLAMAESKIKDQTKRLEKIKAKMKKPLPDDPIEDLGNAVEEVSVEVSVEEPPPPPPPLVRQKAKNSTSSTKKKPIVIVEQNSDSDSQEEQENVIFIKRRPKKKDTLGNAVVTNPFAMGYRFYDRNAMS